MRVLAKCMFRTITWIRKIAGSAMITAVVFMLSIGFILSLLLTVASRIFYVKEDPRLESVKAVLPGLNCGG